ncbi:MAG TPA: hypothetical protein VNV87_19165, partial [Acidimicrobiales bacterium]|nr:hypothetical protein [Acidimicrobiales bacterium]
DTPFESTGTIVNQVFTAIGFAFHYVAGFWTTPAASAANLFWIGLGALGSFAITSCTSGGSGACTAGTPAPPENVGLNGCSSSSPSILSLGDSLNAGACLMSTNGEYLFIMQSDGNLVLYFNQAGTNYPVWASGTQNNPGSHAYFQGNGTLFVYSDTGAALWKSPGVVSENGYLAVQNDGNVVNYANNVPGAIPYAAWSLNTNSNRGNTLYSGEVLNPSQTLTDNNYTLTMQTNGAAVLSQPNSFQGHSSSACPLWTEPGIRSASSSGINYQGATDPGAYLVMQPTGNLALFSPSGTLIWQSNTPNYPGATAILGSNGELSIYANGGQLVWDSNTESDRGAVMCTGSTLSGSSQQYLSGLPATGVPANINPSLLMQNDCNLVLYEDGVAVWASNTDEGAGIANDPSSKYYGCYAVMEGTGQLTVQTASGLVLWGSSFINSSPPPGPSTTGPYMLEFTALNGSYTYAAEVIDQTTGSEVWYTEYNTTINHVNYDDKSFSPILGDIPGWVNALIGIIAAFAI